MASGDDDRRRSARRDEGRARMRFGAHLAWLHGFPVERGDGLGFVVVPRHGAVEEVPLEPARIERSVRATKEIERDLGEIRGGLSTDDLAPRWDRVAPALALLGPAVRERALPSPLPLLGRRAAALAEALGRDPSLLLFARAAGFTFALTGDELDAFEWLRGAAHELHALAAALPGTPGLTAAMILARLALDGHAGIARRVLALLGDPTIHATPLVADPAWKPSATGELSAMARQETLGHAVTSLLPRLLDLAPSGRRRGPILELLVEAAPLRSVRAWADYYRARARYLHDKAAVERVREIPMPRARRPRLPDEPAEPPRLRPGRFTDALLGIAKLDPEAAAALASAVRAISPDAEPSSARAHGLVALHDRLSDPTNAPARELEFVRAVGGILAGGGAAAKLALAWPVFSTGALYGESAWWSSVDPLPARGPIEEYLYGLFLLDGVRRPARALYDEFIARDRTAVWAASCAQRTLAAGLPEETQIDEGGVILALALGGDDEDKVARALCRLLPGDLRVSEPGAKRLVDLFTQVGERPLLDAEVEHGSLPRVARWTHALAAVDPSALHLSTTPTPPDRTFLADWPEPLHPALAELAPLPDAAERARRLLRRELPTDEALETELRAIENLLEAGERPALRARATSLAERIAAGRTLSPARVAKLDEKIRRAAHAARLDRIDDAIRDAFLRLVWPDPPATAPDWWSRPELAEIVAAVCNIEEPERRLGLALVARRAGPPPWLPWDHAANRRFLDRLAARGIDTAPWLDRRATISTLDERPLHLALEDDPLEIFRMGEHFSTCLSFRSCNFFSTITNAVDVNKRVLYGRAPSGAVLARCLLALDDDGRILTFEPYAHDPKLRFGERVAAFAEELARAMRTRIGTGGAVSTLVARHWYDDGTRDLTGRMAAIAEGTPLRRVLAEDPPAAAIAALDRAIDLASLSEPHLLSLLELGELAARPALLPALASRLLAGASLSPWMWTELARRLHAIDQAEMARSILQRAPGLWAFLIRPCYECGPGRGCNPNLDGAMNLLVELDPFLLLRALRRTRAASVRRLDDEPEPRRNAAAAALRKLGRHAEAARLLRKREPPRAVS